MVDQALESPCIPPLTQGLSNLCHCRSQSADDAPKRSTVRNRYADIIKARLPSKFVAFKGGRRAISPSPVRQMRPVSFPCALPRLSFGEELPDADDLFCNAGGSSDLVPLPFGPIDRRVSARGRQVQREYHEECATQLPVEYASMNANPASLFAQPFLHQAHNAALLESCISQMMTNTERRPVSGRSRRTMDQGRRPLSTPLPAEWSHAGNSPFRSSRQPTGNAATPTISPSHPNPEALKSKTRLDSSEIQSTASQQEPTLCPLGLEICRDSGAYVPGQSAKVPTQSQQQEDTKAVLATTTPSSKSHEENSTAKEIDPSSVPDQPTNLPSPASKINSQQASRPRPPRLHPNVPSLRTSRSSRFGPKSADRPQDPQASGPAAETANSSPSSRADVLPVVDETCRSSRTQAATPPPTSPSIAPCDPERRGGERGGER